MINYCEAMPVLLQCWCVCVVGVLSLSITVVDRPHASS